MTIEFMPCATRKCRLALFDLTLKGLPSWLII